MRARLLDRGLQIVGVGHEGERDLRRQFIIVLRGRRGVEAEAANDHGEQWLVRLRCEGAGVSLRRSHPVLRNDRQWTVRALLSQPGRSARVEAAAPRAAAGINFGRIDDRNVQLAVGPDFSDLAGEWRTQSPRPPIGAKCAPSEAASENADRGAVAAWAEIGAARDDALRAGRGRVAKQLNRRHGGQHNCAADAERRKFRIDLDLRRRRFGSLGVGIADLTSETARARARCRGANQRAKTSLNSPRASLAGPPLRLMSLNAGRYCRPPCASRRSGRSSSRRADRASSARSRAPSRYRRA